MPNGAENLETQNLSLIFKKILKICGRQEKVFPGAAPSLSIIFPKMTLNYSF